MLKNSIKPDWSDQPENPTLDEFGLFCPSYNPDKDLQEVEEVPVEEYDLNTIIQSKTLSADVGSVVHGQYNKLEVGQIVGRVNDPFMAMEVHKAIKNFNPKSAATNTTNAPAAPANKE